MGQATFIFNKKLNKYKVLYFLQSNFYFFSSVNMQESSRKYV